MRSSALSTFAILAGSLLAKEVLAGRYDMRKRASAVKDVLITEEVIVLQEPDGSLITGTAVIIGTSTIDNTPVVDSSTVAPTTDSTTAPVRAVSLPTTSSSSSHVVDDLQDPATSTPVATPTPTTTSTTAAAPTTLATSTTPTTSPRASTTTSTAAASSTASGNERGLAYNDISLLSGFLGTGSQVGWCYNWASSAGGTVPTGLEFVPMLWGLGDSFTSGWSAAASSAIAAGSTHMLAFNEPDLSSQSNIGYQDAAAGYMQYMQPFAGKAKLGSPAVTNGSPAVGMGLGWLSSFIDACDDLGCEVDFVNIHWYNPASDIQDFQDHVTAAYTAGGNRPVWITEIGASGTVAEQQTFLEAVMPWLEAQTFVERYAYFMVSDGSLISTGTTLSALGTTFAFD